MMLYQVSKLAPGCWQVAAFADRPGWLGPPVMVTRDLKGRKAAYKLARTLAGTTGRVATLALEPR